MWRPRYRPLHRRRRRRRLRAAALPDDASAPSPGFLPKPRLHSLQNLCASSPSSRRQLAHLTIDFRHECRPHSDSPEPVRVSENRPRSSWKKRQEPQHAERDRQLFGVIGASGISTRVSVRPDARPHELELRRDPHRASVKQHPEQTRPPGAPEPMDATKDLCEDQEHHGPPRVTVHRDPRLPAERRSDGPTTTTSPTAASTRITSHDGSTSTRRTLNLGARGSAW